jgi:hypothetical protein
LGPKDDQMLFVLALSTPSHCTPGGRPAGVPGSCGRPIAGLRPGCAL